MDAYGTVSEWHDAEGWGVIDAVGTPGPCWTHFSAVVADGYRALVVGQRVRLDWQAPGQDGYSCRAVRVWLDDSSPGRAPDDGPDAAYRSSLNLDFGS